MLFQGHLIGLVLKFDYFCCTLSVKNNSLIIDGC